MFNTAGVKFGGRSAFLPTLKGLGILPTFI